MLRWVLSNPASWTGKRSLPIGAYFHRSMHTPNPAVHSGEWHSSESSAALDRLAASRTASALNDALGSLNAEERKRIYSVYRPVLRPSPSDYLEVFRVARATLERSALQRCSDVAVSDILSLLNTFCALWAKPLDPRNSSPPTQGSKGDEWLRCDDRAFHAVVASGLGAAPPLVTFRTIWHIMTVLRDKLALDQQPTIHAKHRGSDEEHLLRQLLSPASTQDALSRAVEVVPRDASDMLSCFEWCAARQVSQPHDGRTTLRNTAAGVSMTRLETVAKWTALVTSAEVVSVLVSATIELGTRECKDAALSLLDRYFKMRMMVHLPALPAEHVSLLTRATESAAAAGDSELVTRILFSMFRARGEIVTSSHAAAGSRNTPSSSLLYTWPWTSGAAVANASSTSNECAAQYEQTIGMLLSCAVRAACVDGGVSRGVRMFDALRIGASFPVTAAMGLELLRVHARQHANEVQQRFVSDEAEATPMDKRRASIAQSGYLVLSTIFACIPSSPTDDDKKMVSSCILACMQLHYAFHPMVIPVLRPRGNEATTTHSTVFASCEHYPARTLELFYELSSVDDATLLLALASAAALRDKGLLVRLLVSRLTERHATPHSLCNFVGNENPCPKATAVAAMFLFGLLSCATDIVAEGWLTAFRSRLAAVALSVAALQIAAASKPLANPEPLVALNEWLHVQLQSLETHTPDPATHNLNNDAATDGFGSLQRMAACAIVAALQQQSWIGEGVSSSIAAARAHVCQRQVVSRNIEGLLHDVSVVLPPTDLYFDVRSEVEGGGGWTVQEKDASGSLSQSVVQHVVVVHHSALHLADRKGSAGLFSVLDVFKAVASPAADTPALLLLIPWQTVLSRHRQATATFVQALRALSLKGSLRIAVVADARNIHLDQPSLAATASSASVPRLLNPDAELDQVVVRVAKRVATCVRSTPRDGAGAAVTGPPQRSVHVWWENEPSVPQLLSFLEGHGSQLHHVSSCSVQQHRALDSVRQLLHVPRDNSKNAWMTQPPQERSNVLCQQLQRGPSDSSTSFSSAAQRSGGLLRSSQKHAAS